MSGVDKVLILVSIQRYVTRGELFTLLSCHCGMGCDARQKVITHLFLKMVNTYGDLFSEGSYRVDGKFLLTLKRSIREVLG